MEIAPDDRAFQILHCFSYTPFLPDCKPLGAGKLFLVAKVLRDIGISATERTSCLWLLSETP